MSRLFNPKKIEQITNLNQRKGLLQQLFIKVRGKRPLIRSKAINYFKIISVNFMDIFSRKSKPIPHPQTSIQNSKSFIGR